MEITLAHAEGYFRLALPYIRPEELQKRRESLAARLRQDPTTANRVRVAVANGSVVAGVCASPWYSDTWRASLFQGAASFAQLVELLGDWHQALLALPEPPGGLLLRRKVPDNPIVERALLGASWDLKGERFEFRTPVSELPPEDPSSPLEWKTVEEVGRAEAAKCLSLAGVGPEWDEHDNAADLIDQYLSDADLMSTPDCVQIGYLDGRSVAFICAQTDQK